MEGILENLLGRYAGKWSLCECGKRTELGPPGSLTLSLANNLILEQILLPIGNMRAMDHMLSEVYSAPNHLLSNYSRLMT